MNKISAALLGSVATISLFASASRVYADTGAKIETVIVTAEKRETTLATTPETVNVVSGKSLEEQHIITLGDLKNQIPSLTLNEAPGGLPGVSLRGIGSSAANQLVEQSVGLFVDGVYEPRAREFTDALFDIDHLEVVKGSQGVLFGKNTTIGAISILSARPGETFGGYASADYEAEFGSYGAQGAVDLPVSDDARIRLSALYDDSAGYVKNKFMNRDEPNGRRWVLRGVLDWDVAPGVNVFLKLQGSGEATVGNGFQYLVDPGPLPNYGGKTIAQLGTLSTANYVNYNDDTLGREAEGSNSFDPTLIVTAALGGGFTLTATTGYTQFAYKYGYDSDTTPQPLVFNHFREKFSQVSQEIRLSSPTGQPLEYIVGLFALHNDDLFNYDLIFNGFNLAPALPLSGAVNQQFTQKDDDYAAFAQASWHISPSLTFDLGGRLNVEDKTGLYVKTIPTAFNLPIIPIGTLAGKINDTTFDASGTLSYKMTDSSVLYASVGRGSKAGAFNNTSLLTVPTPSPFIVPMEVATTYEVGVKGSFFDDSVYASLAAFAIDVGNFQDSSYSAAAQGFVIRSINARTRGIEGEAQWQVNDWFQLYGNFAYTPLAKLADGQRMQRSPEFTGVLGAKASARLTDDWTLEGNVELANSSSYFNQPPLTPGPSNASGAYSMVDARLAVISAAGWEFSIDGKNLNDAVYRAFTYGAPLGGLVGVLNRPRTVMFTIRKNF